MARYFRGSGFDKNEAGWKSYRAVATSNADLAGSPYGEVTIDYTPGYSGPIWDNGDNRHANESTRALSKATGVSHELIKHISQNDQMLESDDAENLSNIINWEDNHRTNPEGFKRAVETIKNHPLVNTGKLFGEQRGRVEISTAYFDRNARNLFPTTVSLIKQDHPNAEIVASPNLSPHSSKVSKNAAKRGLISSSDENPENEALNTSDFETKIVTPLEARHMGTYLHGEIPEKEVQRAKRSLREDLRMTRTSKMSSQFSGVLSHDQIRENTQNFKIPESWNSPHKPKLPGLEN